jgi:preprotein translocase subunit YajC
MNSQLFIPLLLVLLIIPLVLSGRRQKKAVAQAQQLQSALTEGDVVTTTSGLRGTVHDASYEDTIDLEIAPGVVTTWLRAAVRDKVTDTDTDTDTESHDDAGDTGSTDHADAPNPAAPQADGHVGGTPGTGPTSSAGDTPAGDPTAGRGNS